MTTLASTVAHGLTAGQLREYGERGYLVLPGRFTDDIDQLRAEADDLLTRTELISKQNMRCRWLPHRETGEYLFECFDPVIDLSTRFATYGRDPRILDPLRAIYGDEPCLRHDQFIYKPPGCDGYTLHQDFMGWEGYPRSFTTVVIALDRTDSENGCIEVYPGLHRRGYLSPIDDDYHAIPEEMLEGTPPVDLALEPGDVALFGCFLPHRSRENRSRDRWRRQLFFSYNALSDGGDARGAHYDCYRDWLRKKYAAHGKTDVYFR